MSANRNEEARKGRNELEREVKKLIDKYEETYDLKVLDLRLTRMQGLGVRDRVFVEMEVGL